MLVGSSLRPGIHSATYSTLFFGDSGGIVFSTIGEILETFVGTNSQLVAIISGDGR